MHTWSGHMHIFSCGWHSNVIMDINWEIFCHQYFAVKTISGFSCLSMLTWFKQSELLMYGVDFCQCLHGCLQWHGFWQLCVCHQVEGITKVWVNTIQIQDYIGEFKVRSVFTLYSAIIMYYVISYYICLNRTGFCIGIMQAVQLKCLLQCLLYHGQM